MLWLLLGCTAQAHAGSVPADATLRHWIVDFEHQPRGPFKNVLWYCNDGTVLPPEAFACLEHGGGFQHGEWNAQALAMREHGYLVANMFTAIAPDRYIGSGAKLSEWKQILLEQYMMAADDGWIYRRARYYRGAIQIEAEQDRATQIILKMLNDPDWLEPQRFLLLRETARLLPLAIEPQLGLKVRQLASDVSEQDAGFNRLRIKIHSMPDKNDAARVRRYAKQHGTPPTQEILDALASQLDALYASHTVTRQLKDLAAESRNIHFRHEIAQTIDALQEASDPEQRVAVAARKSVRFRHILEQANRYTVYNRLRFLRASLMLEQLAFGEGNRLLESIASGKGSVQPLVSRESRLAWLESLAAVIYATGLLSDRQWLAMDAEIEVVRQSVKMDLADYTASLRYISRTAQWCQRQLEFHFASTVAQWLKLSPKVQEFVPDRLRGSPLLPFMRILDTLVADADRIGGVRHRIFGQTVRAGARALNPGVSRGRLLLAPKSDAALAPDGIYLMPFTRRTLTPIAGIITRGEGSSVSHIQLLARNLGIPNLFVNDDLFQLLHQHLGERIVMAVSHQGLVRIEQDHGQWDAMFAAEGQGVHDLEGIDKQLRKINLRDYLIRPLHLVRARDSGRTIGPKAANLGQLSHYFPDQVNPGLVVPFGLFRHYLEQPFEPGGQPIFTWMKQQYARIAELKSDQERNRAQKMFLSRLRNWILHSDPGISFRQQVAMALGDLFGPDGSYGVFVRSDTNLEDLPGFNGAGLNLTVANVVGVDNIMAAILRVWASPFTDRAFAWRQAYMPHPEALYPAVLLMKSVPAEKSGVLVTADIESGDRSRLSIAVNEGIGGAVEGQFAEEIRVDRKSGGVQLLAQASDPEHRILNSKGGLLRTPVSGRQAILTRAEIAQLMALAVDVEKRFPLPKQGGRPAIADIEFGFVRGKLELFQIRPFVESRRARRSLLLAEMDRQLTDWRDIMIRMDQPPHLVAQR